MAVNRYFPSLSVIMVSMQISSVVPIMPSSPGLFKTTSISSIEYSPTPIFPSLVLSNQTVPPKSIFLINPKSTSKLVEILASPSLIGSLYNSKLTKRVEIVEPVCRPLSSLSMSSSGVSGDS